MYSKFDYVPYDSQAKIEQNRLRGYFKFLEEYVTKGWKGNIEYISIPDNEYKVEAGRAKAKLIDYISSGKIEEALIQLDNLYYLLGKDIRLRCIERIGGV